MQQIIGCYEIGILRDMNLEEFLSIMSDTTPHHPIHRIDIRGISYAYKDHGQGPLVLLIHGFPDDASSYDESLWRLAERDTGGSSLHAWLCPH